MLLVQTVVPLVSARSIDLTDEMNLFATAGIAATFRVSSDTQVVSAADHRLPNTDVVLGLLKWIER